MDSVKQDIIKYCRALYANKLVAANDGNISVLLDADHLMITPTATSKGELTEDMLITLDFEGAVVEGTHAPSSEAFMHIACYKARSDIGAVVHAHPPFATALAATEEASSITDEILLPEILITTGRIGMAEYASPGSRDLAVGAAQHIANYNGILLKNHGALTVGKDVREAYYRMESIEMYCKVKALASLTGKPHYLSTDEVEKLLEQYHGKSF